ncbi:general secretion pathway protein H [Fontimonas thermophila]|uniref:Type II secretion system protein H n=1 Tax=Fontimonas thermophila TaxID=1076937 RepID=A0A1I2HUN5_9GAMM|nr:type II secretion system minor pseudopilin GspH [Fontimonas thermophila]SFF32457.1 general secretion pathway protein H [Fontimonas thermophila]
MFDRQHAGGFTLVEILVVVLIIGIMLTFATLSVGDRASIDTLDSEARRLEQLFRLAQEEAELNGRELGFRYTDQGYQFLVIGSDGQWLPVAEGPLRPRRLPPPLQLALRVEDRPVPPAQEIVTPTTGDTAAPIPRAADETDDDRPPLRPQVMILSSGEFSPFVLDVRAQNLRQGWRIAGTLLGQIRREPLDMLDQERPA